MMMMVMIMCVCVCVCVFKQKRIIAHVVLCRLLVNIL